MKADVVRKWKESLKAETFEAGQTVIKVEGAPLVGVLLEGLVKLVWRPHQAAVLTDRSKMKGGAPVVGLIGDSQWMGLDVFGGGVNRLDHITLIPSRIALMSPDAFDAAPSEVQRLALQALSTDMVNALTNRFVEKLDLREQVLSHLLFMRGLTDRPEIQLPQDDFAAMVGLSRQALNKVLKGLEKEGVVELGYKQILIGSKKDLAGALGKV